MNRAAIAQSGDAVSNGHPDLKKAKTEILMTDLKSPSALKIVGINILIVLLWPMSFIGPFRPSR